MAHDLQLNELLQIFDDYELDIIKLYKSGLQLGILPSNDPNAWKSYQLSHLKQMDKKLKELAYIYGNQVQRKTQKTFLEIYQEAEKKEIERMAKKLKLGQDNLLGVDFGEMNFRTMAAALSGIQNDLNNALYSLYRQSKDNYRMIIQQSAILKQTGNKTLRECIDLAQSDYLAEGLAFITYTNGNKVNIRSYAEMALRTNSQRAMIAGQGSARNRLGIYTVRVSRHGITCPLCAPWQGQVLIDDVYADGQPDGIHPLLSEAIATGFLHPNCRHNLISTDIEVDTDNTQPYHYTQQDADKYIDQQTQRQLERDIRKAKREATGYLSPGQSTRASKQVQEAQKALRDFLANKPYLKREYDREQI